MLSNVVNTEFCTKVGMTSKVSVGSVLEQALLTCIARIFEAESVCMGAKTNLSCFVMSRKTAEHYLSITATGTKSCICPSGRRRTASLRCPTCW